MYENKKNVHNYNYRYLFSFSSSFPFFLTLSAFQFLPDCPRHFLNMAGGVLYV